MKDPTNSKYNSLQLQCYEQRKEIDRLNERIKRLEEALSLIRPTCEVVHHSKKHQHSLSQPCPVVELIKKAKEAKL